MTATAAPSEVLRQFVQLMGKGPDEAGADLVTTDAVLEPPYLLPGAPPHRPGREAFTGHLRRGAAMRRFDAVDRVLRTAPTPPSRPPPSTACTARPWPPESASPSTR
ncbi:hypothetical protein [Kitasatospora sp. NPDC057500]|uniref:hypothetical protein n=1 Tax=Kitasatospora sp. NPDC057500 TaxID=3346151 RepID=UPI00368280FF